MCNPYCWSNLTFASELRLCHFVRQHIQYTLHYYTIYITNYPCHDGNARSLTAAGSAAKRSQCCGKAGNASCSSWDFTDTLQLEQTARVLATANSNNNATIGAQATKLRQVLPGSKRRFHEALDELETELVSTPPTVSIGHVLTFASKLPSSS